MIALPNTYANSSVKMIGWIVTSASFSGMRGMWRRLRPASRRVSSSVLRAVAAVMGVAVGMAEDVRTGIVDRLRALPISRIAVLAGRALSELAQVVLGLVVFTICGLAVGWQPHGTLLETAAAYALLVLWAFAGVWIGTLLGMVVRDAETAQTVGFTVLFPMMFLSAIFVPIAGLPAPLKQVAEYNPLSAVAGAMRELFGNPSPYVSDAWPLVHPVAATVVWSVGIVAVVAPLAVRRYRRLASA